MTPSEAEDFFFGWGLHISDGVDGCSGTDDEQTERAAQALSELISKAVAEQREADAKACDEIYQQYGELARHRETQDRHQRLKAIAAGARECAGTIRIRGLERGKAVKGSAVTG